MNKYTIISSGIPKLDDRLGGGFFSNSMVLVSYQTGTRFVEFLNWIMPVKSGKKFFVVLVDYYRPVDELLNIASVEGFSQEKTEGGVYLLSFDRMRIINCFSSEATEREYLLSDKIYTVDEPFDTDRLFSVMRTVRKKIPEDLWVIWTFLTLTDLSVGVSEEEISRFIRRALRLHKQYGDIAFYLLNMDAHSKRFLAVINQLMDVVINFKVEEAGEKLRRYIQVIKSPLPNDTTKLYYDVDADGKLIVY
ncbi:MAG: RAD55 family ATPase [Candidatus Freyrarchaeum guaymaensis]